MDVWIERNYKIIEKYGEKEERENER